MDWDELAAGQTYIGDAEILWVCAGQATGTPYCKSRDGGIWAWNTSMRRWIPVGGE